MEFWEKWKEFLASRSDFCEEVQYKKSRQLKQEAEKPLSPDVQARIDQIANKLVHDSRVRVMKTKRQLRENRRQNGLQIGEKSIEELAQEGSKKMREQEERGRQEYSI